MVLGGEPSHDLDDVFGAIVGRVSLRMRCSLVDAWTLVFAVERIGEFSLGAWTAWWVPGTTLCQWVGVSRAGTGSLSVMTSMNGLRCVICSLRSTSVDQTANCRDRVTLGESDNLQGANGRRLAAGHPVT
jgi:hypothetical protein